MGRIGSWLGYRTVEVEAALALALALGLGVPLEYLIVSVLASLFLGRPLTRGASGSGSGGGKLGIIASGDAMPVVQGTLEAALGGALGAARVTLARLAFGGGVPMSKKATSSGTVGTGIGAGAGGGCGGGCGGSAAFKTRTLGSRFLAATFLVLTEPAPGGGEGDLHH